MAQIAVDFDKVIGPIKPMHCINNAPICGTSADLFPYIKQAGIPYARLHDTGGAYGGGRFVDIHNIFRDFDADVEDEASYDFAFTDWLLENIIAQGTSPFFRLGTTIENGCAIKPYYIFPPRDYLKWAKICEKIILHYNEGWANGYRMGVQYWEIWNEPDNHPNPKDNPMWQGTMEQYFALYKAASVYLKTQFPDLKIGGYGSCGVYAILDRSAEDVENAKVGPRFDYFIEFMERFLLYVQKNNCPLDFFSWHSYGGVLDNIEYSRYVRRRLDEMGFLDAESILDEWNPGIERRGTLEDMAKILEMMIALQNEEVDMLMYYDGQVHGAYQGLFDPVRLVPYPALYAMKAFDWIYRLGSQVDAHSSCEKVRVCAAKGAEGAAVLLVNPSGETVDIELNTGDRSLRNFLVIDDTSLLEETPKPNGDFAMKGHCAILARQ